MSRILTSNVSHPGKGLCTIIGMFLLICANTTGAQTGTVLEQGTNTPLQNALVSLKSTGDLVLTDAQGRFEFAGSPVRYGISKNIQANPVTFHNGILNILSIKPLFVLEIYKPDGTRITKIKSQSRSVDLNSYLKSSSLYVLQISIESSVYIMNVVSSAGHLIVASSNSSVLNSSTNLRPHAHIFAGEDTLIVSKYLYTPVSQAIAAINTIYLSKPATPPPPPGMKSITGGVFMMGSELGEPNETPVHEVELSDFYLDSTEVTQADFISLMEVKPWESNTGYIKGQVGPKQPVWYLNWYDAVLYCNARSKRDGLDTVYYYSAITGNYGDSSVLSDLVIDYSKDGYRLPTEAEWEYACRAGTTTEYYWGNTYDVAGEFAWHRGISGLTTQVVAQKKPNGFGIHDMCGNVYEWVNDWRSTNYLTERLNPKGPVNDVIHNKITRGLSFYSNSNNMRSAYRGGCPVHERNSQTGFRVAKNK